MIITRRDRYQIYPTPEQVTIFRQNFGCSRFVYNQCIDYADKAHRAGMKYPMYTNPFIAMSEFAEASEAARKETGTPLERTFSMLQEWELWQNGILNLKQEYSSEQFPLQPNSSQTGAEIYRKNYLSSG